MPVGLAIGGLGALGSIGGAWIGSNAAKSAADIQQQTALQVAQMQQQQGQKAANLFNPYVGAGQNALTSLASLYGVATPGNPGGAQGQTQAWNQMLQTPAYQFAQSQGQLGLDRSSAANGLLLSGAQLKDTMSFNQGLASQQIGNYTNALQGMAGLGMQGVQGQASALTGTSQMVGNTQMSGAQSAASGVVGSANAWMGGLQGASGNLLAGYGISQRPNYGGLQSSAGNSGGSLYNPSSYSNSFWNGAVNPGSSSTSFGWG